MSGDPRAVVAEGPVVVIFGARDVQLQSAESPDWEAVTLRCYCFDSDRDLEKVLIEISPQVIITIGREDGYPKLLAAPFDVRRRWLNYPDTSDLQKIGSDAFYCYLNYCIDTRPEHPLVSIITPTYRTGERFLRAYRSVLSQTYTNWEWVLWDDSDDDGATHAMLAESAEREHRLRVIQPERHSGVIGEVKYNACMAARGELLVELDHDDELTSDALELIVSCALEYPQAGFFYSDFAEVTSTMESLRYPDGWGYGYGTYRDEIYNGHQLAVAVAPNINAKTIRGLVAAPNHVRCWRRDLYLQIGGHNRMLPVADDMELMIRTFLASRMMRIPRLCYLQFQHSTNTQTIRNKEIQRHVRYLREFYDRRIHERFVELGVDDWIWNKQGGYSDLSIPNPLVEPSASLLATR